MSEQDLYRYIERLEPGKRDRHWAGLLCIFVAVPSLRKAIDYYIDFGRAEIDAPGLRKLIRGSLSHGESVMLQLALHLFNDANPLPPGGLTNLRHLDNANFEMALLAIRIAHGDGQQQRKETPDG